MCAECQQKPAVGPTEPRSHLEIEVCYLEATQSCGNFPWAGSAVGNCQFSIKMGLTPCFHSRGPDFDIQSHHVFLLFALLESPIKVLLFHHQ